LNIPILALINGRILPFDRAAAVEFADIITSRRLLGRPIGILDAQIAAIARARGMAVATRDVRDFADTGVTVIDPWA
jgi:toxin FitB